MIGLDKLFFDNREEPLNFDKGIDVVDLYNNGVIPLFDGVEGSPQSSSFEIPQLPSIDEVFADIDQETQEIDRVNPLAESRQKRSMQEDLNSTLENNPFALSSNPFTLSSNPFDQAPQEESQIVIQDQLPFEKNLKEKAQEEPLPKGSSFNGKGVRVLNTTRDRLKSRKSIPGSRIFSQDFNDDGTSKKVSGIEIVVPSDATKEEKRIAKEWVKQTHKAYKDLGVNVPIRHGDGLKIGGRGVKGFFHLEDHFSDDAKARNAIKKNPMKFARITAGTLGRISGSTFINPHKKNDPGMINKLDGLGEREFSEKYRTPYLIMAMKELKI